MKTVSRAKILFSDKTEKIIKGSEKDILDRFKSEGDRAKKLVWACPECDQFGFHKMSCGRIYRK